MTAEIIPNDLTGPELIEQLLFEDIDEINIDLAEFVPLANKIADAAATFIAKADKRLSDDKRPLLGENRRRISTAIVAAKQVIKISDGMSRQLRLHGTRITKQQPNTDDVEAADE